MDTISISINTRSNYQATEVFNSLQNTHIFKPSLSQGDSIVRCKVSYPKAYDDSNAYLITSTEEVLGVHTKLANRLKAIEAWKDITISLSRVDLPFTHWMDYDDSFNSYSNVFRYAQEIFSNTNKKSTIKGFEDFSTGSKECLYYNGNDSYRKNFKIYNQHKNFEDKFKVVPNYGDLEERIRIEYSRKVKNRVFSIIDFETFDIFTEYFYEAKTYLLENSFNIYLLQKIQELEADKLYNALIEARQHKSFTYDYFISITDIKSYEPIQKAIKMIFPDKIKSYEKAITKIRKAIKEKESREGVQILNTSNLFKNITDSISDTEIL